MSMKPILFSTEMVRGLLSDTKTVTRRAVKGYALDHLELDTDGSIIGVYNQDEGCVFPMMDYAPYRPGDILYVRETWRVQSARRFEADARIEFKAGGDMIRIQFPGGGDQYHSRMKYDIFVRKWADDRWHPSIHMPREAARIFLRVTAVRVERLQDITEEQAKVEGAIDNRPFIHSYNNEYETLHSAREHFAAIWDNTIKKAGRALYGWDANPWVWVIEFERCERPKE